MVVHHQLVIGIHLKLLICQCVFQTSFNQDIGTKVVTVNGVTYTAWDTLNVTNISFMFYEDIVFNGGSPSINNGIHLKLLL
jgi:hypothetical protein